MQGSSREEQNVSFCLHLVLAIPPFINNMLQLGTLTLVKLKNCFLFGRSKDLQDNTKNWSM